MIKLNNKNIEESYQLSPMQQGMLFHYQRDAESGVDIEQMVCSLNEELNTSALKKAWEQVLMRHPTLRTSFRWEGINEPLQNVNIDISLPFDKKDLRNLPLFNQQSQIEEYLKFDRKQGFDLSKAPLMRLMLFQFGDANYKLIWTFHHIIIDGRAHFIILKEVFDFYEAICHGQDVQLGQPRPYRDYIEWLKQKDFSKSEIFWKQLLDGFTAPTKVDIIPKTEGLNADKDGYAEQEIRVTESLTSTLKTIAEEYSLTLNTFFQGAWALLLNRYTGDDDVVFGSVRACRHSSIEGVESIVGLFINTLPVRVRISSDQSLVSLFKEIRKQYLSMRNHEHIPLLKVLGWSQVHRDINLFESITVFDNYELNSKLQEQGGKWQYREFHLIEKNIFPLTLYGYGGAELLLRISYEKRRFDNVTIKRMLGHLTTLLEGIADNINRPISSLSILTCKEKRLLLEEWNNTRVEYPQDLCIHQLFEIQTERTPDTVAVVFENEQLTYKELNLRANQLAYYLQSIGIGPDVLVGIAAERSMEMVVGLYGILKSGGAYVPLDPTYPPERIAYMLENAQVPVLLTQSKLLDKLPLYDGKVICLDTDWDNLIADQRQENPVCKTTLENLAYVIYTSGSTGKPKGVMNTHGGILNRLLWMQDAYQLTSSDRVLQKTPFSFDASVWEFFWTLMFGACLVVSRPEGHKDNDYLVQLIIEKQITTIHFVPSMLQLFVDANNVEKCDSLRQVFCSGEALPVNLQNRFFAKLNAKLHNLYGPTEAAVDVTYWECQKNTNLKTVPIGRPVANTKIYILDRYMQPVPIGVPGELHIDGVQVARGYLNRPDLTAEKFISDPFSDNPKARLYKTGDLARYLSDGNIEYLGRLDHQVKMRGFRIELGEIESVLSQHPAVREAVVLAYEDIPDNKRLVAYVVLNQRSPISTSELRNFLKAKLPDFMVPAGFVLLDAIPLTPNGKVDRISLPTPEGERQTEEAYIAPRNELEKIIASIWQKLLQVEKVGINDNFFDLGGHSLLIVQAHRRLHEFIDKELSITDMFRYPSIEKLSKFLTQEQSVGSSFKKIYDRARKQREIISKRKGLRDTRMKKSM
ncbi:MAG: amino acid adenylation domain-containing protein [Nitrospirota bacterium]